MIPKIWCQHCTGYTLANNVHVFNDKKINLKGVNELEETLVNLHNFNKMRL